MPTNQWRTGDLETDIIRKILNLLSASAYRTGDEKQVMLRKILTALGGQYRTGDLQYTILRKIVTQVGGHPVQGDLEYDLLRKWLQAVATTFRQGDQQYDIYRKLLFAGGGTPTPPTPPVPPVTILTPYDDLNAYTPGTNLNGQNLSAVGVTSPITPSAFSGPYVSRGVFARVYANDDMASYTNGAAVNGLNGGVDFNGAYVTGDTSFTSAGLAWAYQVVKNGGAFPSSNSINAVQAFYDGLVSDGIDSLMLMVNPIAPDSLIAAQTPIPALSPKGSVKWASTGFVGGDLSVNGLTGDGATKLLDTGFNPNAAGGVTTTSGALAFYAYTGNTTPSGSDFGALTGGGASDFLLLSNLNGGGIGLLFDCYDGVNGRITSATNFGNGFYLGSRTAANSEVVYFARSNSAFASVLSGATNGGPLPNVTLTLFAAQGIGQFCNATISFAACTKGLSSAQGQLLYNRVQTLRTSLGGGFR